MLTVHAAGGDKMIKAAVDASGEIDIIAVTLLTSLKVRNSSKKVEEYTDLALNAGANGVVCSANEVKKLRKKFGNDFKIIVPGIRPVWYEDKQDDQKRTGTPAQVISDGASYIVVGRPITYSTSPKSAAYNINKEIQSK